MAIMESSHDISELILDDLETVSLVEALSNARGASGFEDEVIEIARDFCRDFADFETNSLRCGFLTPHNFCADKPTLLMDAHGDEVSLMVKSIRDNGCLSFIQLGHFSQGCMVGEEMLVRTTENTWIHGVIGAKPPHFMTNDEKTGNTELEMTLDVGATSGEDAIKNFHIGIGEPVVPATSFSWDPANRVMFGKAFDCRVGVAAMLLSLREFARIDDLPLNIVAVVSSQEENGGRGIATAVRRYNPIAAYLFEGAPADDTFGIPADMQCRLKRGPMFRYADIGMITNPAYQRFVLDVARECALPAQGAVRAGGGTNGRIIHLMQNGIPCVVSGIPSRYIHSGCAISALDDIHSAVRIAVQALTRLTPETIATF